jgi:hypothetical protein
VTADRASLLTSNAAARFPVSAMVLHKLIHAVIQGVSAPIGKMDRLDFEEN